MAAWLKTFNCEFLVKPIIAMSEFGDTILKNAESINSNLQDFDITQVQRFMEKLEPLYPDLHILNRKSEIEDKNLRISL